MYKQMYHIVDSRQHQKMISFECASPDCQIIPADLFCFYLQIQSEEEEECDKGEDDSNGRNQAVRPTIDARRVSK